MRQPVLDARPCRKLHVTEGQRRTDAQQLFRSVVLIRDASLVPLSTCTVGL